VPKIEKKRDSEASQRNEDKKKENIKQVKMII